MSSVEFGNEGLRVRILDEERQGFAEFLAPGEPPIRLPCHFEHLETVATGIDYHVAAPGAAAAFRHEGADVKVEIEVDGRTEHTCLVPAVEFAMGIRRIRTAESLRPQVRLL